ncbi:unnamed protein product [Owenia fusiformis]|uniref:Uncharacterized protein n=1 Tax=Owenia fusiformis TaxID=6347 RepID=A0A8J1TWW7_OWEFU|nr:unnamed protein product [Owenia fusiformis]
MAVSYVSVVIATVILPHVTSISSPCMDMNPTKYCTASNLWDCWPYGQCTVNTNLKCTDFSQSDCVIDYCLKNVQSGIQGLPINCTADVMNGNNGRKKRDVALADEMDMSHAELNTTEEDSPFKSDLEMSFCLRPVMELMSLIIKLS